MGAYLKKFLYKYINNRFSRFLFKMIGLMWTEYSIYIWIAFVTCGAIILLFIGILLPFLLSTKNMSFFYVENPSISDMIRIILEDRNNFENIFSPAAALFSGMSSLAAVILLFWQINIVNLQRKDANRATLDRWVYQMSLTKTEIIKEILVKSGQVSGRKAFHHFCYIIDNAFTIFKNKDSYNNITSESNLLYDFYEYVHDISNNTAYLDDLIEETDNVISELSSYTLNTYFHNVYTTLKMIFDDKNITTDEKKYYMRIYRSQFTQQELKVIYIHALTTKDDGELKFKNLIEETGFFHSLNKKFMPLEITESKFPDIGYQDSAFKS